MARTQAADYEERRVAIVEKAASLFARRGYLGTSLNDLAEACETSKSLVYHYFASKEDILFEVMDSHLSTLASATASVRGIAPAEQKLRALVRVLLSHYATAASRHRVLLNELDNLPPAKRRRIVLTERKLIIALDDILAELQPALPAKGGYRRAATMLLFGMINWTHTWFDPGGKLTHDEIADLAADLIIDGLKKTTR